LPGTYAGAEQSISVTWDHLTMLNGQTIDKLVFPSMTIQVHRPVITGYHWDSPRSFMNLENGRFSYGDPSLGGNGQAMHWWVELNSRKYGYSAVTQLAVQGHWLLHDPFLGIWWPIAETHGWAPELDNTEFYIPGEQVIIPGSTSLNTCNFRDLPDLAFPWPMDLARINANMLCYVRFKPGTDRTDTNNIYVTLATVNWTCNGVSMRDIFGIFPLKVVENETPPPNQWVDSIEFPVWDRILRNSQ